MMSNIWAWFVLLNPIHQTILFICIVTLLSIVFYAAMCFVLNTIKSIIELCRLDKDIIDMDWMDIDKIFECDEE